MACTVRHQGQCRDGLSQSAPHLRADERTRDTRAPAAPTGCIRAPRTGGLGGYLRTLRERRWLVLLAVVLTTGAAVAYVLKATKVYEGEAAILVTPVPETSEVLVSVGLISTSVDPLRAVETVAALIDTIEVARRAQQDLKGVPEATGDS